MKINWGRWLRFQHHAKLFFPQKQKLVFGSGDSSPLESTALYLKRGKQLENMQQLRETQLTILTNSCNNLEKSMRNPCLWFWWFRPSWIRSFLPKAEEAACKGSFHQIPVAVSFNHFICDGISRLIHLGFEQIFSNLSWQRRHGTSCLVSSSWLKRRS